MYAVVVRVKVNDVEQAQEAANQQSRADHQHTRQGNFSDHQRVANPPAAPPPEGELP